MSRAWQIALPRVATAGLAWVLVGCDDGPQSSGPPPPPAPRAAAAASASTTAKPGEEPIVHVPNPTWSALDGYFERFLQEPPSTRRDPLRSYITAHVARPELPVESLEEGEILDPTLGVPVPDPAAAELAAERDEDQGPLQRYAVDEYKLLLIMSGTAVPKAVIEDPIGNTWVVRRNTPLGNRGGVVDSITQYAVVVREPDADDPLEKTVRPLIFEAAPGSERPVEEKVFGAERLTGPPL